MHYRQIWEHVFGTIPTDSLGRPYEIHHIDGDRTNNDLTNLKCVSIEEHYQIHLQQGEYGAANLIAERLKNPLLRVKGYKKPHSEATKAKLRKPKSITKNYRKSKSKAHAEAIRQARLQAPPRSKESRLKMRESALNRESNFTGNHIQVECPHCSKVGQKNAMLRWHFTNCKIRKEVGYAKLA